MKACFLFLVGSLAAIFIIGFIAPKAISQTVIQDDFSDGDLNHNPSWLGDTGVFVVNSNRELQLNAPEAGMSRLFHSISSSESMEWRARLRMAFSPSDNNRMEWQVLTSPDSSSAFVLAMGKNGSEDAIDFYFRGADTDTLLIAGEPGTIVETDNEFWIKLSYNNGGWRLWADFDGYGWYRVQGEASFPIMQDSWLTQFLLQYTSSNVARFYLDDIYVGPPLLDSIPPRVEECRLGTDGSLKLIFSEMMDSTLIHVKQSYVLSDVGMPVQIDYSVASPRQVILWFEEMLAFDQYYELKMNSLTDTSGLMMADTAVMIFEHRPAPFDVVFNEIMADPSPRVELPEREYIELFNRSEFEQQLNAYRLTVGSRSYALPEYTLAPGSYLFLTSAGACLEYPPTLPCLEVLGNNVVSNEQTFLQLVDTLGEVMAFAEYRVDWFPNSYQADGGWSLECIDPENFCGGKNNWSVSTHFWGGTPGKKNSVLEVNPDFEDFRLIRGFFLDSTSLQLVFSKSVDWLRFSEANWPPNWPLPDSISSSDPLLRTMNFYFSPNDSVFHLTEFTLSGMRDVCGNSLLPGTVRLAFPQYPEPGDVVINELLFNPFENGVDYVELYHRGDKVVDLKQFRTARYDSDGQSYTQVAPLSAGTYLLFPGDYFVLTTNKELVMDHYPSHNAGAFPEFESSLPTLSNEAGSFLLLDQGMQLIDVLVYEDDWQHPSLADPKGVALERVHPNWPSAEQTTWASAAETVGFGTPGLPNSQWQSTEPQQHDFYLENREFSPDRDGLNDYLFLHYRFDEPGYFLQVSIFDSQGRYVRSLSDYVQVALSGQLSWDGTHDSGGLLPMGVYLIHLAYFHPNGKKGEKTLSAALVYP